MSESPDMPPPDRPRARRFSGMPLRTTAINLALIATIFLTRGRWEAWVVRGTVDAWQVDYAAFSPYSDRLATASQDADNIWLSDVETGECLAVLECGDIPWPAVFSPDGRHLLATPNTGPLVWDMETMQVVVRLTGDQVVHAEYSRDGRLILLADRYDKVHIWDATDGRRLLSLKAGGNRSLPMFLPDGTKIAVIDDGGSIKVLDARDGRHVFRLPGAGAGSSHTAFSADGRWAAVGYLGGSTKLWDVKTGACVAQFEIPGKDGELLFEIGSKNACAAVAFSPNDSSLAIAGIGVAAVDVKTRSASWRVTEVCGSSVRFSPDGRRVLCGEPATVLDAESGEVLADLSSRDGGREDLIFYAYSPRSDAVCLLSTFHGPCIYRRVRPEWWWGVFLLPHFWLIAALALALAASVWWDLRKLRRLPR